VSDSLLEIVDALRSYAERQCAARSTAAEHRALPGQLLGDRRAHVRLRPIQLDRPVLARLRRGPLVTLLDVSASGALIQTDARLTPGAQLLIEFLAPSTRQSAVLRSRIVRSHVAGLDGCVRYRGACSFDGVLDLADFLPAALELPPPPTAPASLEVRSGMAASLMSAAPATAGTCETLRAVRELLADQPALDTLGVTGLLDEVNRMAGTCPSRSSLMAYVEAWLRRQVPLLAMRVNAPAGHPLRAADVLSFKLPVRHGVTDSGVNVEFRPACALSEAQVRLLEAGACVMSIIQSTR
jgi:hypothetical protein